MSNTPITPTPDQMQPPAGAPPTGTPPAQAPSGVGSAITGQPSGQPTTGQPTAQPTPNAVQPTPTTAAGQPNQPNADPMDAHVSVYRKFLQGFKSPVGSYVDPNGNVKPTNVSLGRTVLAAILAGMSQPATYHQGAYGPIRDNPAPAAFAAGQKVVSDQNAAAQALSDKQQAMKLSNIKNSIDQVHLMAALTQQKHQELQGVLDSNQPALDDFKAMDDKQADPSKKIILSEPMTFQQAMDSPLYGKGKMTTNSILMSGRQSVYDPETGETHEVPLFTILSPDAGHVTISEDQKNNFSTINRSFDGMSGLDARIPIHQYLALQGNLTSVQHFQSFIKRADEQLGIKENADLAAAVKKDPTLINGIRAAEGALAQGGSTADTLQRIQHGTNGTVSWDSSKLFDAMGLDQDKVAAYIREDQRERARQDAADKEAGKIDLKETPKPQTPQEAATLEHTKLENKKLSNDLATAAKVGDTTKTGPEYLATLSPQDQAQLKAVHEGRQGLSERQLGTKDGKILSEQLNAAYPDFDATKYPAYNKMRTSMTSGPISVGVNRFNTALQHLATMDSHVSAWSTIPGLKSVNALVGGDAANLEADRTAVKSELAAAYKGGIASQGEVNDWEAMLDVASPYELKAKIKELGKLLQGKLTSYQNQWDNGAPRDVVTPVRIISPEGRAAYKKITGETLPPVRGDVQTVQNVPYTFDGTQWVKKAGQ
jgi:hypothetical protein